MKFDRRMGSLRRGAEPLLWTVAAVCLSVVAFAAITALCARHSAAQIVPQTSAIAALDRQALGDVIGRMEIPALSLSVPMTAGIESSDLLRGVGHVDGTAMPGGLGTLGLAGHRDTYLRPLQRVAAGMDIRVIDHTGTYHYIVDSTEIVTPEHVSVLDIRSSPELALITCYPFYYVGAAPKRFIVHAHLASVVADHR